MAWVLRSPQIHSSFSNLGYSNSDGYHINENCNAALEAILHNISSEDKVQRTYRRSIRFGQNIKKDIIPLLIHTTDDKTVELLIKILVNLTIPVECLLSLEINEKTDVGRHTIFEINSLLVSIKTALTDHRVTKVIIEFLKKNAEVSQSSKLSVDQRDNISNTLLFLRNVLHIPEEMNFLSCNYNGPPHKIQNQIIWNLFSQSADKVLLKLITIPDAIHYAVTMVQLIALFYKDQHANTLHKLLNIWLETSLSESSEDNESNTSPQNRGSDHSSPILTSNPTSDSSDNAGSGKSDEERNSANTWVQNADKKNNNEKQKPSENGEKSATSSENGNNVSKPSENETNCKTDTKKTSEIGASIGHTNSVKQPSQTNKNNNYFKESAENDASSENDNNGKGSFENSASSENDTYYKGSSENCASSENDNNIKGSSENSASSENDNNAKGSSENDLLVSESANTENTYPAKSNKRKNEYTDQIENQEATTTSSNEDELPNKNQYNSKTRSNNKARANLTAPERRRKKIVKRGKLNIINAKGVTHTSPTDDDISNVLKEFTIEFLFKGYNSLVQTLHRQILSNVGIEIDTSHFFWLVTYFLKFATQIELDLQHLSKVLSFDIISYLTAEGVNLCEQFELIIKLDGNDLKPCVRRLHLAVTAIREFIQAIEAYKKSTNLCNSGKEMLLKLQVQMCETDQLCSLLVLLLRHYNPVYHTKQYLQDIIVTNHILLTCLDTVLQSSEVNGTSKMVEHIRQFSTPEIMHQYGVLLEDFEGNGKFVNDCVFTMMYHVAGEMGCLMSLVQPGILKTFTSIWKSEFEICDDWSDIIEYAISAFVKKPHKLHLTDEMLLEIENCDDDIKPKDIIISPKDVIMAASGNKKTSRTNSRDRWSEHELSSLNWYYMQCKMNTNVIGEIVKLFKEDGVVKTYRSIAKELLRQHTISKEEYDTLRKHDSSPKVGRETKKLRDNEIGKLCGQLSQDGKAKMLDWVQTVLIDTCHAKIYLEKTLKTDDADEKPESEEQKPVVAPVSYHAMLFNQSVPLVPWNCQQAAVCKDLKFLQLLNKLGFQMPVDTGKVFIRIPSFWTADYLYEVAGKISPVDPTKLRFSLSDISQSSVQSSSERPRLELYKFGPLPSTAENFFQVHKERHLANILNFTPMPGSSFDSTVVHKPNWLELVQKSQEYKITLDLERSIVETNKHPDVVEQFPRSASPPVPAPAPFPLSPADLKDPQADFECCNNSVCETASVASDLTRMYVSDEDDKSTLMSCPMSPAQPDDDMSCSDSECGLASKRPRLQFLTPF